MTLQKNNITNSLPIKGSRKDMGNVGERLFVCWLLNVPATSVSQGRICSDNFTYCHTEIEVADPTFYLTQSQYTDTGPTSPSTDPIMPGTWQDSHWSANFWSHWYDSALILPSKLSSLQTPCPSCRPSSQIGTLKSMTCLLLLPHFVDAMKSPYNGYHLTATCLEMRLLTLWQRRAQQKSKWIDPPATLRWRPSSRPSNTASGGTSTHGTTRLTPTTC